MCPWVHLTHPIWHWFYLTRPMPHWGVWPGHSVPFTELWRLPDRWLGGEEFLLLAPPCRDQAERVGTQQRGGRVEAHHHDDRDEPPVVQRLFAGRVVDQRDEDRDGDHGGEVAMLTLERR